MAAAGAALNAMETSKVSAPTMRQENVNMQGVFGVNMLKRPPMLVMHGSVARASDYPRAAAGLQQTCEALLAETATADDA